MQIHFENQQQNTRTSRLRERMSIARDRERELDRVKEPERERERYIKSEIYCYLYRSAFIQGIRGDETLRAWLNQSDNAVSHRNQQFQCKTHSIVAHFRWLCLTLLW